MKTWSDVFEGLPKAAGLFITATDTEASKTLVTGAIARLLRDVGTKVGVLKPVASGWAWPYTPCPYNSVGMDRPSLDSITVYADAEDFADAFDLWLESVESGGDVAV